jgi:hypothetical protein
MFQLGFAPLIPNVPLDGKMHGLGNRPEKSAGNWQANTNLKLGFGVQKAALGFGEFPDHDRHRK